MRKSLKSNELSSIIRLVSNCKFLILWVIGLFFLSGAIIAPLEAADGTMGKCRLLMPTGISLAWEVLV
jgi:hypothetical protein